MNKKIIFTLIFMCSLQIQSSIDRPRDRRPIKKRTLVQDLCVPAGSLFYCWMTIKILESTSAKDFHRTFERQFVKKVERFASKRNFILADLICFHAILAFFSPPILFGAKRGYDISERFGK